MFCGPAKPVKKLIVDKFALDWFDARNISFSRDRQSRLKAGDSIIFCPDIEVEPYVGIYRGTTIPQIGFMSYSNSTLPLDIRIGRYCSLAPGIAFPLPRHPIEHLSTSVFTHERSTDLVTRAIRDMSAGYDNFFANPQKGAITIGHDVWIGQGAAIMPGITIGMGSVVAAHSVVTRSVEPYSIIGGNPAAFIRKRFSDELVSRLIDSRWWEYRFIDFDGLDIGDPLRFLDGFEKRKSAIAPYRPANPIKELMNLVRTSSGG